MRRQVKVAVSWGLASTRADRLLRVMMGQGRAPLIVTYHRVVEDVIAMRRTSIPAMLISSQTFERQVDWIARRYRITTLDEIGAHLEAGEPFDERLAAITFDDGYADAYHNAFPILRRKGHPATVFVVTDLIGREEMQTFDRLYLLLLQALGSADGAEWLRDVERPHAIPVSVQRGLSRVPRDPVNTAHALLEGLPQGVLGSVLEALERRFTLPRGCLDSHRALDWEMLEEMCAGGITIGSHTRTHVLLTLEEPARVSEEIDGSRWLLEQRLGRKVHHLAYPDGRFNTRVVNTVKKAGYRFAYGVCEHRDAANPLLTIPRRTLWEDSCLDGRGRFSPSVMSCYTNGVFDQLAKCRREHQAGGSEPLSARPGIPVPVGAHGRPPERGDI
jgi:peptidoglycan/xylan/chitin deacetylase (PgdA/CDA1 family)